jgi:hypothetical protein
MSDYLESAETAAKINELTVKVHQAATSDPAGHPTREIAIEMGELAKTIGQDPNLGGLIEGQAWVLTAACRAEHRVLNGMLLRGFLILVSMFRESMTNTRRRSMEVIDGGADE